ncbi:disease resistance protein RGA2 [Quercus suber]|uniref:disease resistance protein RGA2 n=1 Tax=Quercus suber TaxID=58331 RepID=UPI0032DEE631
MAEGVLFDIAKEIIGKAGNLALKEAALIWGVNDEINKLKERVSIISAVILDAEAKQHDSAEIKLWLQRLKDAMCDADDLLDEISTEALRREVMTRDKKAKEVRIFFSKSNQLAYGVRMGHKVKEMRERLVAIAADRQFHLDERCEEIQVRHKARRETHSLSHAEAVIGREDDKKAIIGSLLDPNAKENVSVLAIVGLGGLGKTTVAQLVFNDEKVKNHFELKLWVCVSENFDAKIIVKKILECVKHKKPEDLEMNLLANDVLKEINGKRYLIVLDDVWNEDREKWFSLKKILMGGARGSRIVMTTRSQMVAKISQTIQPHVLQGLDEQHAWSLFKKMAFEEGEEPKNASFVEIGKEILKKCAGVPLAIKTIGGLLYFKKTEMEWLSFKINELSKIRQNESDILPTLKLSYDLLASHLKQCFAYCSLFPKDYKIDKSSLINMWMAQGFITLHDKIQCPKDIGHEYFMDLLWRSFFQEVEKDELGNISTFKIHDLMHDIAIQVTGSESTTINSKEKDIDEKTRHVSFGNVLYSSLEIPISLYKARRIRTFLLPCQPKYDTIRSNDSTYSAIVASFKFIRLLDLHNMGIKTIPSFIKKLKHLRYLDLSKNEDIEMLPNSIVKLYNLQTLKLYWCKNLKELPRDINKLVNLKFLEIDLCWSLTHMPNGLGQLTNLQTLSRFVMSKGRIDSVPKSYGKLKELNRLNDLRGKLSIENLKHGKDAILECKDANLKEKQCLDRLDLDWEGVRVEEDINETGAGYDYMSLEALQPHVNLKALRLQKYGGVIFPRWLETHTNLVQFDLYMCNKCQYLPPLDQFPSLKIIFLYGLDGLEHISDSERDNSDSLFYPSLEKLSIRRCRNLKGWWRGRRNSLPSFPRLSYLDIMDCPNQLTSFPLFPYLERLTLEKCSLKQSLERMMINNKTSSRNLPSIASSSSSTIVAPLSKLSFMWIKETEEALPEEWLRNLISLRTLYLDKCPLPQGIRYLTALQHLEVKFSEVVDLVNDWDEMEWQGLRTLLSLQFYKLPKLVSLPMGLQYLNSLQNLEISFCPSLIAIPEWICKLISLQSLKIWHCPNLESLPEGIDALTSLQTLHILNCPKLESLPEGFGALISLQTLHISNCPNLESLPEGFGALTSLQTLYISNCPNLESLPEGFGALTSLQTLHILNCPKLESLPEGFGALTSLQTLYISNCPKLESLPEGFGALTTLQTLQIYGCPILLKRCKKQIGEDWHKISHIPNLKGELSRPEEEPDEEEPEKPDHKNWDLIKAFGCCNCSTIQQLTH